MESTDPHSNLGALESANDIRIPTNVNSYFNKVLNNKIITEIPMLKIHISYFP